MLTKCTKFIRSFLQPLSKVSVGTVGTRCERKGPILPIRDLAKSDITPVDCYWGEHTVNSPPFTSQKDSLQYLEWRFDQHPLFREFMDLYGNHDDQTILDYGCGPGNDLVGFLVHTRAKKVIGVDISKKALKLAEKRLALHHVDPSRIELVQISDSNDRIPLTDQSVDYVFCEGVLHHTSHPESILKEFHRVMRLNSVASVMVYNSHSLWLHLYTAYEKMILEDAFHGMTVYEAFARNTDGDRCPISRCYTPEEFIPICKEVGFKVEYIGGYFSLTELECLKRLGQKVLLDDRLGNEHKEFIRNSKYDQNGLPTYMEKHAGIGGVYLLRKDT